MVTARYRNTCSVAMCMKREERLVSKGFAGDKAFWQYADSLAGINSTYAEYPAHTPI